MLVFATILGQHQSCTWTMESLQQPFDRDLSTNYLQRASKLRNDYMYMYVAPLLYLFQSDKYFVIQTVTWLFFQICINYNWLYAATFKGRKCVKNEVTGKCYARYLKVMFINLSAFLIVIMIDIVEIVPVLYYYYHIDK